MSEAQHYYIACIDVVFETKTSGIQTIGMNTLITRDKQFIRRQDIDQMQRMAVIRFHNEALPPSPDLKIHDALIKSISYLGEMTEEEFMEVPAKKEQPESLDA